MTQMDRDECPSPPLPAWLYFCTHPPLLVLVITKQRAIVNICLGSEAHPHPLQVSINTVLLGKKFSPSHVEESVNGSTHPIQATEIRPSLHQLCSISRNMTFQQSDKKREKN